MKKKSLMENSTKSNKKKDYVVVKRNGKLVPFCRKRIHSAISAAFQEEYSALSEDLQLSIDSLTNLIEEKLFDYASCGSSLTVEGIQDFVEISLMKKGFHGVAKRYILYRNERTKKRASSAFNRKILRHDKQTLVRFNPIKIASSIEKALRLGGNLSESLPNNMVEVVNRLTDHVMQHVVRHTEKKQQLCVTDIQDIIEYVLMEHKFFAAAKGFIVERTKKQEMPVDKTIPVTTTGEERSFVVISKDNEPKTIQEAFLKTKLAFACRGFSSSIDLDDLLETSIMNFYEGMKEHEVDLSNIFAARAKVEKDPAYAKVAARLLLDLLYRESIGIAASDPALKKTHQQYFKTFVKNGVRIGRLDPALLDFDLDFLAEKMDLACDDLFLYLGLQTLYDRYLIHDQGKRLETPQIFWMRVSMGLALQEEKKEEKALEFYQVLSTFSFISSTPTLFNAGTVHPQLSSCYLSTVEDDLESIFKLIRDDAMLSKWAGGLGNDWTCVRATGAKIHGTNGTSQGVIPFLKVANDTALAVNQCFSPETLVYTSSGAKPIAKIQKKDLVLGISGVYREVLDTYVYSQKEAMLTLYMQDGSCLTVTDEHPFYVKKEEKCCWVPAKQLQPNDLLAQIIPQEVTVCSLTNEDIQAYGAFLRSGFIAENGHFWCLKEHNVFLEKYLAKTGRKLRKEEGFWMIDLLLEKTGSEEQVLVESGFPFTYEDVYDDAKQKRISPRFAHLPLFQTKALLQGVMDGKTYFNSEESLLLQDIKYQYLRTKTATVLEKNCINVAEFTPEVTHQALFVPLQRIAKSAGCPVVYDLLVETDASYMTTSCLAHNGGKRKGAMCAYLELWHLDIEEFLELRKNTGDERRRTHDMNTANWVPDLFMKRVQEDGKWTLFSPSDTPDLHDLYGQAFEKRYEEYEKMAANGDIVLYKTLEAKMLWRKMLSMLFETGHPWITFKDPSNIRSSQDHVGVVHSSNLCTEILLNTNKEEVAVCNLGSVNLKRHMSDGKLDEKKLQKTIQTAVRMLDNVIDINFYPIPEARTANFRHRPVGLGMMGFQDALYLSQPRISYNSEEAAVFADESMEMIAYYAYSASSDLAKERGKYSSYSGSKWDRGFLPLDTLELLEKERKVPVQVNRNARMPWDLLRKKIAAQGMRNSNVLAIAPTATIANIAGVVPSIEPLYKHLFVKSNLSGEFTNTNPYLVEELKKRNLWNDQILDDLKYFDGSIQEIPEIPEEIKQVFLTAFEIDYTWIIECAARRQKWLDMGQSLNLYLPIPANGVPNGRDLDRIYFLAWLSGLKTTYYFRALAATQIEKSSIDVNRRGLQPRWMKSKSASGNIQVERNRSCSLEEGCESCQ